MASANFRSLALHMANAAINFGSVTLKCMLVSSVPSESDLDTWDNRNDVTTEVTGTGYTAGGVTVTATVGSLDTTNNRVPITFTDLAPGWTTSTISAAAAIIYVSTGTSSTDKLVAMADFGGTVTSTADDFTIDFTAPLYINA